VGSTERRVTPPLTGSSPRSRTARCAQVDATTDPEWNAKDGDNAWDAALMCIGYISPAEAEARFQKRQGNT
jgi:hypothetical protein